MYVYVYVCNMYVYVFVCNMYVYVCKKVCVCMYVCNMYVYVCNMYAMTIACVRYPRLPQCNCESRVDINGRLGLMSTLLAHRLAYMSICVYLFHTSYREIIYDFSLTTPKDREQGEWVFTHKSLSLSTWLPFIWCDAMWQVTNVPSGIYQTTFYNRSL